jgi:hypothetical protein
MPSARYCDLNISNKRREFFLRQGQLWLNCFNLSEAIYTSLSPLQSMYLLERSYTTSDWAKGGTTEVRKRTSTVAQWKYINSFKNVWDFRWPYPLHDCFCNKLAGVRNKDCHSPRSSDWRRRCCPTKVNLGIYVRHKDMIITLLLLCLNCILSWYDFLPKFVEIYSNVGNKGMLIFLLCCSSAILLLSKITAIFKIKYIAMIKYIRRNIETWMSGSPFSSVC